MPNPEMSNELKAALDAARAAAEVIRGFYQRNVKIEVKADKTPVTEADVRSEEAIRELLTQRFPSYGFYGEETGKSDMNAESVWLVDPIDGTKSFVRECPFFSTQIALMRGGRFVLGVSMRAGLRRAGVGRTWQGRVSQRQADSREQGECARRGHCFHRQSQDPGGVAGMGAFRRVARAYQSHPRLRRFRALPPAGARRPRRRDRVGREYPRHRGADRHRRGSRRKVHGPHGQRR